MANNNVLVINQEKVLTKSDQPPFHVNIQDVHNPHKFQLFVDYGNEPGPWLKIGINDTIYGFGYLPKE